ncbi:MAG: hypothetical protein ACR2HA_08355 [Nocardioides sp.]
MGNVNLPTPVAVAGGVLCVLGGYLLGVVIGPDTATRSTATVDSYDADTSRLCLSGEGVEDQGGDVEDGVLCGTWRRTQGSGSIPESGDQFRFISLSAGTGEGPEGERATTVIYGDVVR